MTVKTCDFCGHEINEANDGDQFLMYSQLVPTSKGGSTWHRFDLCNVCAFKVNEAAARIYETIKREHNESEE